MQYQQFSYSSWWLETSGLGGFRSPSVVARSFPIEYSSIEYKGNVCVAREHMTPMAANTEEDCFRCFTYSYLIRVMRKSIELIVKGDFTLISLAVTSKQIGR